MGYKSEKVKQQYEEYYKRKDDLLKGTFAVGRRDFVGSAYSYRASISKNNCTAGSEHLVLYAMLLLYVLCD
jgi:hypothetical protein